MKVFVGDAVVIGTGLYPALSDGSRAPKHVVEKLRKVGVTDGRAIYHSLYASVALVGETGTEVVPIEEVVKEAEPFRGSICEILRHAVVTVERDGNLFAVPTGLLVYGGAGWFENFSTAPISLVRSSEFLLWKGIPVFLTYAEPEFLRPNAPKIIRSPTSALLGKECGISFAPQQIKKKETGKKGKGGGLLLSLMKRKG